MNIKDFGDSRENQSQVASLGGQMTGDAASVAPLTEGSTGVGGQKTGNAASVAPLMEGSTGVGGQMTGNRNFGKISKNPLLEKGFGEEKNYGETLKEREKNENMDNTAQENSESANGTAVQKNEVAQNFGKFKSVDALYSAYLSLEAEFTRRSQRLKELEEGSKAETPSPKSDSQELLKMALSDEQVKTAVIEQYIKSVAEKKVPLLVGGNVAIAPQTKPKSVKDAGRLATEFLKS